MINETFRSLIINIVLFSLCELNLSYYLNKCTSCIICICVVILIIIKKDKLLPVELSIYTMVPQLLKIFIFSFNMPYISSKLSENDGAIKKDIILPVEQSIYRVYPYSIIIFTFSYNVPYIFSEVCKTVGAIKKDKILPVEQYINTVNHNLIFIFILSHNVPFTFNTLDKSSAIVTSHSDIKLIYCCKQIVNLTFLITLLLKILAIFTSLPNKQLFYIGKLTYNFETETNLSATITSPNHLLYNMINMSFYNLKGMKCNFNCQSLQIINNVCVSYLFSMNQLEFKDAR